jgi:hypothetical protein
MGDLKFYGSTAFDETPSGVTATPSTELGSRRFWKGEEYVYCYNAGGATASAQYGVKIATGASGYSIAQTSLTDVCNPCVGVVKHADIPAASYGWVMTKGFASVKVVTATTADYVALALGAAGVFINAGFGTSVGGTSTIQGYGLNVNTAAGGSLYAFIRTVF